MRRMSMGAAWMVCALAVMGVASCAGQKGAEVEESEPIAEVVDIEPQHEGRLVELSGAYTAELAIRAFDGMVFVYLYESNGDPVEYAGKTVKVTLSTPDGETTELALEGMGQGFGAHFMNLLDEKMLDHMKEQAAYSAHVEVTGDGETQSGSLDVDLGS